MVKKIHTVFLRSSLGNLSRITDSATIEQSITLRITISIPPEQNRVYADFLVIVDRDTRFLLNPVLSVTISNSMSFLTRLFAAWCVIDSASATCLKVIPGFSYSSNKICFAYSARLPRLRIRCSTSFRSFMISMKVSRLLVVVSIMAVRKKVTHYSRLFDSRTTVRASFVPDFFEEFSQIRTLHSKNRELASWLKTTHNKYSGGFVLSMQ